jgi:ribosomal protein L11
MVGGDAGDANPAHPVAQALAQAGAKEDQHRAGEIGEEGLARLV